MQMRRTRAMAQKQMSLCWAKDIQFRPLISNKQCCKPLGFMLDQAQYQRQRSREGKLRTLIGKQPFDNKQIIKKLKVRTSCTKTIPFCRECNDLRHSFQGPHSFCSECRLQLNSKLKQILRFNQQFSKHFFNKQSHNTKIELIPNNPILERYHKNLTRTKDPAKIIENINIKCLQLSRVPFIYFLTKGRSFDWHNIDSISLHENQFGGVDESAIQVFEEVQLILLMGLSNRWKLTQVYSK